MSGRFEWVEYKNIELLHVDFSGLCTESYINELRNGRELIVHSKKNNIRALLDVSDAYISKEVFKIMKEISLELNENINAVAIVGSTKIQEIFFHVLDTITNIDFQTFDNEATGKEWLIST